MVKQSLHQSLQQKLSPQQIQLMKLIELSTLELEQKVKDEIETNPALDDENNPIDQLEKEDFDEYGSDKDFDEYGSDKDFDLDQYISDDEIPEYKLYVNNNSTDDSDSNLPLVGGHTHLDNLQSQLSEFKLGKYRNQERNEWDR